MEIGWRYYGFSGAIANFVVWISLLFFQCVFSNLLLFKLNRQTGSKHRIISLRGLKLYFILTIAVSGCVV